MNYFGNRLKILRLKHNLSQIQLSRELHVSQSAISSWENGLSGEKEECLRVKIAVAADVAKRV
ncbi:MAG: helix-turn-helix domain-containing protein, partial [Clostridia bacterium]|nr:helix-turn-helix domain-containing protein [Clostridia bacterium]